ncbi:MAG: ABC transporter ATP-binding protein [Candidatus Aminicenantes bacterium]|nr:ABC transporter ATP-binding protein [Candidatus Aminicenantes bacterium]
MLELRGLTKKYHITPVVDCVSFSVHPSEILGYLGPNGAGKTTTIKMLAGLLKPSDGKILYNGRDIRKDIYAYKEKLGYVPEESEVYPHLSAYDYLLMVGRLRHIKEKYLKEKIAEFMRLFHLSDDMDSAMSTYSKGMVQKVLITSALLHNPEILLLDEPLSGLDVTSGLVIKGLLQKLAQEGKIVIYSSHILEVVEKVCSRVIIIHKGKIIADDSVSNLRELMKLPSLGDIFGQLVVQEDTEATAEELVEVMKLGS